MLDPSGRHSLTYAQEIAVVRTPLQWMLLIAFIIFLFIVPPLLFSNYVLVVMNTICITILSLYGLNILTGYCGQISLGHAGFMALGGYMGAILIRNVGMPFIIALPCAGLAAALVGVVLGFPSFRVKGFYLAIVTLSAFIIIDFVIRHLAITGRHDGIFLGPTAIGDIVFDTQPKKYLFIMGLTVLMTVFTKNLMRTRIGRVFVAIRDNDLAAQVMGINIFRSKLLAFGICSFYAGISGALFMFNSYAISPDYFSFMDNVKYLGMLIVGGMGTTLGVILGTALLVVLDELSILVAPSLVNAFPGLWRFEGLSMSLGPIIMGLVIIFCLLFEPRGLAHRWEMFKVSYRLWPFPY